MSLLGGGIALGVAMLLRARTAQRSVRAPGFGAVGLLVAIPLGLALSIAIPMDYILDYEAYLDLARRLYASGDYSDSFNTRAWRPPGMALLYGLPISLGATAQLSVWVVNSAILALLFSVVKRWLASAADDISMPATIAFATLVCLALLPWLLLPIAHIPAIAGIALVLLLVPVSADAITGLPRRIWLIAGLLIGISAMFRPNLLLLAPLLAAVGTLASQRSGAGLLNRRMVAALVACALGVVIALAPWATRNWLTLNRFVPISTNGGMVFYSANGAHRSWEQGTFNQTLMDELYHAVPDEVERDKEGWRRGWRSIAADPLTFAKSFRYRVQRLLGDPLFPVNYLRRQGQGQVPAILGGIAAATMAAFWLLWLQLLLHRLLLRRRLLDIDALPWPHCALLVLVASSLIFENSPTYQMSFLPFVFFILFDAISKRPVPGG
jgi:hypothetical protein